MVPAIDQPREDDRATRVVDVGGDAHALESILERGDVARANVHDRVGIARDGSGVDDFGHRREDALELVGRNSAAAKEFDVGLNGHAVDGGVDLHGERANDPVTDESVDATLDRGSREAHDVADVAVPGPGVLPQLVDDAVVDGVHTASVGHGLGVRRE